MGVVNSGPLVVLLDSDGARMLLLTVVSVILRLIRDLRQHQAVTLRCGWNCRAFLHTPNL